MKKQIYMCDNCGKEIYDTYKSFEIRGHLSICTLNRMNTQKVETLSIKE